MGLWIHRCQSIIDSLDYLLNIQKLDSRLIHTINTCHGNERVDIFIHFKHPPQGNDLSYEKIRNLNIKGINGKRKVLTASLLVSELDAVSEINDVIAITQSTTKHPND